MVGTDQRSHSGGAKTKRCPSKVVAPIQGMVVSEFQLVKCGRNIHKCGSKHGSVRADSGDNNISVHE